MYQGLRILDITGPTGSYAGKLFADLGADVLKIEPPGGDPGRLFPPFAGRQPDPNRSIHWWFHNTSKRGVVANLTNAADRDRILALARDADVLIDTAPPGSLDEIGFGYDVLSAANPRLIQASLTPFGQTGPRKDWRGTDLIASSMGGLLYLGGVPEHPPSWPGGDQSAMIGAGATAVGVALALLARDRSGTGQRIDVSMQEATTVATENAIGYWNFRQFIRPRLGHLSFSGMPMVFKTTDGFVIGHVGGRWDSMLDWFSGHGFDVEAFRSDEWLKPAYRAEHIIEFEPTLTAFLGSLPKEQIFHEGQQRRIVFGPIRTMPEVLADRQLAAREFWHDLTIPGEAEPVRFPGAPYRLSNATWSIAPAPALGDDALDWLPREERPVIAPPLDPNDPRPLRGIRVVDFGTNVIVPLTGKLLAAFGAEVIKVEGRTRPDGQRNTPVPRPVGLEDSPNSNWLFLNCNSDKRSFTVNMPIAEAQQVVRSLVAKADVVIDNFGVDPMPKWGMSAAELHALNPELIILRASVMGRSGPMRNYVGLGNSIMAAIGLNSITGFAGDPPVSTCTAHPDYSSNTHHALFSILSCLYQRNRTGKGQVIDMSQTESTVNFVGPAVMDAAVNHYTPGPSNNRHPLWAPHGVFPCEGDDRWIAIACPDDATWQSLAGIIDPALTGDARFATAGDRKANEDALDDVIRAFTAHHEPHALMERLQVAGVPAGVVQTSQDLIERDPQYAARHFLLTQQHPEVGEVIVLQPHPRLSATPGEVREPAPLLGDSVDWVIGELLALDDDDVANLYIAGAVE